MDEFIHTSVLVKELNELLQPGQSGGVLVDATLGEGGHSEVFLSRNPELTVLGVERDPVILDIAKRRLAKFGNRIIFFNEWFHDFFRLYDTLHDIRPDRILFDLGVSQFHFKKSGRGFSFQDDSPLDMRLNPDHKLTAAEIIARFSEKELFGIFREYGEERFAGRIARRIVQQRRQHPLKTARQFGDLIKETVPPVRGAGGMMIHPATRCFQALRIYVNREMENLDEVLDSAFDKLLPGGRMAVISYHSLEDRRVKNFFREKFKVCNCPPEWPVCRCGGKRELTYLTKKPLVPEKEEISANRAARSARLRVIEKL